MPRPATPPRRCPATSATPTNALAEAAMAALLLVFLLAGALPALAVATLIGRLLA